MYFCKFNVISFVFVSFNDIWSVKYLAKLFFQIIIFARVLILSLKALSFLFKYFLIFQLAMYGVTSRRENIDHRELVTFQSK